MATIKDVSQLSGTAVGTVSRYLNGHNVKKINREKIENAIKTLDFQINAVAQGLKNKKTMTVGIVIPQLANIFSTNVIEGMEKVFDRNGYSILVSDSRKNADVERKKIRLLLEKQVDGIIIMPVEQTGTEIVTELNKRVPIVLMDRLFKDVNCDAVVCDNVNGAYGAVEAIINAGHSRIALVTGQEKLYTSEERIKGYRRAHEDYNLVINEDLIIHADYTDKNSGRKALIKLMNERPDCTAVFATNYELTLGVIEAIMDLNYIIGKDISLFGYDQEDLTNIIRPSISVVKQPMEQIGEEAARLLIKRMQGDFSDFPMIQRLKTEMIVTETLCLSGNIKK